MADIDYTMSILHRYLKELSIKVSYGRIRKLLATPMGCSVRGISDALDSLHITHEVYQLPATYLSKIEALPCIDAQRKILPCKKHTRRKNNLTFRQGERRKPPDKTVHRCMERSRPDNRRNADVLSRTVLSIKTNIVSCEEI